MPRRSSAGAQAKSSSPTGGHHTTVAAPTTKAHAGGPLPSPSVVGDARALVAAGCGGPARSAALRHRWTAGHCEPRFRCLLRLRRTWKRWAGPWTSHVVGVSGALAGCCSDAAERARHSPGQCRRPCLPASSANARPTGCWARSTAGSTSCRGVSEGVCLVVI